MTQEKFEALEQARIRVENLGPSPLERIKAMCQGAEYDCQEAEEQIKHRNGNPQLAAYYRGRAGAFYSVLSFIRGLE